MMVGRLVSFWVPVTFQGRTVNFQECRGLYVAQMLHATGIFTYMAWLKSLEMSVNIPVPWGMGGKIYIIYTWIILPSFVGIISIISQNIIRIPTRQPGFNGKEEFFFWGGAQLVLEGGPIGFGDAWDMG